MSNKVRLYRLIGLIILGFFIVKVIWPLFRGIMHLITWPIFAFLKAIPHEFFFVLVVVLTIVRVITFGKRPRKSNGAKHKEYHTHHSFDDDYYDDPYDKYDDYEENSYDDPYDKYDDYEEDSYDDLSDKYDDE